MTSDTTQTVFVPPYIAFRTLMDLIKRMADEEPPARIDKSYLHTYSGGYQTQVLAALSSLGLVDEVGMLQPALLEIVAAPNDEQRKRLMAHLIHEFYGAILRLGLSATQQMMLDAFSSLAPRVTGDTRRKAVAFFLAACAYGNIPVSRHWKTPRVPPSGKPKKTVPRQADVADDEDEDDGAGDGGAGDAGTNVRRLSLRSGGVVTLGLSVDLFALSATDREFVFTLVDKMAAYEGERMLPAAKVSTANEDAEEHGSS